MTQKKIQAKEVLGTEYYNYNITSTNYNPSLNTTITITVTVTDVYNAPINNLSVTLQNNGIDISSKNTNTNGVATWTYTCSTEGLQKFHVGENTINVYVDNKSELGHTHSQYLTSHQDISGKANINDLGAVAFSNNYNDLSNKPNIPNAVTVDTTLSTTSNNAIANSTVKNALDTKLDRTHTSYKGKNVVTNSSTGEIEFEEKNNHTHSQYLTSHQDISGKIDTAGTGLSKTGTTLNHSNSVTSLTTASFKKVKYDGQGHITGTSDVSASDLPSHTHTQSQITDFPSIPSASNTTPSADTQSGSVGTGTTWARSNHTHPKSSIYAEASHTHSQYLTSHQDISGKEDTSNKLTSLQSLNDLSTDTQYPSAKLVYTYWSDLNDTLQNIQNNYPLSSSLGAVAFSNDYTDLDNLPSFGNLAFENDVDLSGHDLDELSDNTNLLFSGDYDDLDNKPTIPTQTSQLTNNSGFITSSSLSNYLQQSDVKDNLTSTDTNKPLSAKQGKELKTLIDNKPTVTVDSTWVANSTNPIQSKEIKTALDGKANVIDFYYDNLTDELVINTSTDTDFEDLVLKEDKSNKVSSWSNTPDNNHYPTEKLVKDYIDEMIGDILEYINS